MDGSVRLDEVVMRFGDFTAIDKTTLEIGSGEFFIFLGPSGCGKTTLLNMISGFLVPSEGRVLIGDEAMGKVSVNRRPTAMIFQNLALFPLMTVFENIEFGLEVRGVDKRTRRETSERLLALVALEGSGPKQIGELSGGQKQRVAIARALAVAILGLLGIWLILMVTLFANGIHRAIFFKTLWSSVLVTLLTLAVSYPLGWYLAKVATPRQAALCLLLLIIPFWINEILRTYSWFIILAFRGPLNEVLMMLRLIDRPIRFLSGDAGVMVGMVYAYILFMVFPVYNAIESLDDNQVRAARDLGAGTLRTHWRIVIPHAKPGIATGCCSSIPSRAVPSPSSMR